MTAIEKLLKLADDAERKAQAYRLAAAALNGHAQVTRTARAATVLDAALEVDAERRQGRKPKSSRGGTIAEKLATRERTAKLLEVLGERGPFTGSELVSANGGRRVPFGPFLATGLIKKGRQQVQADRETVRGRLAPEIDPVTR